jgi:hypothetical protein
VRYRSHSAQGLKTDRQSPITSDVDAIADEALASDFGRC